MNITLFENVSKRINSTYRPSGGVTRDVRLKEPTDFLNPVFMLQDMNWNFNMVYAFGMYYRVTNRVLVTNNIQELHCKIDSLATAKDYISSYDCFIERCDSQYTQYLDDSNVSVIGNVVSRSIREKSLILPETPSESSDMFSTQGCYLIRVIAPPPVSMSSAGVSTGIVTYTINRSELYKLLTYAFSDANFTDVLADATIKAVFNPLDYLIDIKWLPVSATDFANNSTGEPVALGWWVTDAIGYPVYVVKPPTYAVYDPTYEKGFVVTVESTLGGNRYYTDYRLTSPRFTKANIYIPGVGTVDIDSSELVNDFYLKYTIDRITGDAFAELYTYSNGAKGTMLGRYSAQLSCKINLAQASVDMQGVVSNLVGGSASLYTGNYVSGAMSLVDVVPTITNPSTKMIGENGSTGTLFDALFIGVRINIEFYGSCDRPNTCGKPLYKNRTIGNLSGFVKCGNASLSTPFLEPINEEVNQLLNSGFYLE